VVDLDMGKNKNSEEVTIEIGTNGQEAYKTLVEWVKTVPKTRFVAGWGLILLLIAVYPANIYLALTNGAAMDTTPIIAWGRLPFQFAFIGLAYWHTKP
jgi:uncharacterized membrane protein